MAASGLNLNPNLSLNHLRNLNLTLNLTLIDGHEGLERSCCRQRCGGASGGRREMGLATVY